MIRYHATVTANSTRPRYRTWRSPKSDLIITKYKANRIISMHKSQKDKKKDSSCTKTATHAGEWL